MKAYYVDLMRGGCMTLLAGPFPDEPTARKYEIAAARLATEMDPRAAFDSFGVTSIEGEMQPGTLNSALKVAANDLLW